MALKRIWTETEIQYYLKTDKKFVIRALFKMYDRQTVSEKNCKQTKIINNVGFNKPDGHKLSSFVEFYNKRGYFTDKQIGFVRNGLMKYAGQLTNIANAK